MALEEVVANKLKCLIQRRHSHDLFDLVYSTFIDRSIELDRGLVPTHLSEQNYFQRQPWRSQRHFARHSDDLLRRRVGEYIRCPKSTRFGFDRAVEGFKDSIERLFDGVSSGGWGEQLYFGGEHRHMILEAGADTATLNAHCDIATYFIDRRQEVIGILGMTQSGLGLFAYPDCHELSGRMPEIPSRKIIFWTEAPAKRCSAIPACWERSAPAATSAMCLGSFPRVGSTTSKVRRNPQSCRPPSPSVVV